MHEVSLLCSGTCTQGHRKLLPEHGNMAMMLCTELYGLTVPRDLHYNTANVELQDTAVDKRQLCFDGVRWGHDAVGLRAARLSDGDLHEAHSVVGQQLHFDGWGPHKG